MSNLKSKKELPTVSQRKYAAYSEFGEILVSSRAISKKKVKDILMQLKPVMSKELYKLKKDNNYCTTALKNDLLVNFY